jgi:hypothetical protein
MEVEFVLCNRCGKSCNCEFGDDTRRHNEYATVKFGGGWYSKIGDDSSLEMHLCEDCLIEIMDQCKVPLRIYWTGVSTGTTVWDSSHVRPKAHAETIDDEHAEALAVNAALDAEKAWRRFAREEWELKHGAISRPAEAVSMEPAPPAAIEE